jgi:hypothetical protein
MATLFLVCAILGGTVLVLQLLLSLVGFGADALHLHFDAGHGAHASDALDLLSTRALAAGTAFLGIGGLATLSLGLGALVAVPVALFAGGGAALATAATLRSLARFEDDGTVRLERAIGQPGTVYLRIPGQRNGSGRVLLTLQNRTVECTAVTSRDELATGTAVIVVDVLGPDTVEVELAPTLGGLLDA